MNASDPTCLRVLWAMPKVSAKASGKGFGVSVYIRRMAACLGLLVLLAGVRPVVAESVEVPGEDSQGDMWVKPGGMEDAVSADTSEALQKFLDEKEDPNARFEVLISCAEPELVQGLKAYAVQVGDGAVTKRVGKPKFFDANGTAVLKVPDGRFVFETLSLNSKLECVALRSEEYKTPAEPAAANDAGKRPEIKLKVNKPQKVVLTLDGKPVPITQCWVRSAANAACQWEISDPNKAPVVYTSPGAEYMTRFSGWNAKTLAVKWSKVPPGQHWQFALNSQKDVNARFEWMPDSYTVQSGRAWLNFPDSTYRVLIEPDFRLVTNRHYLTLSYSMTTNNRELVFQQQGERMDGAHVLSVGGPLKYYPFAVVFCQSGQVDKRHLVADVIATDGQGRVINVGASKIDWKLSVERVNSGSMLKEPFDRKEEQNIQPLKDKLRIKLHHEIDKPVDMVFEPGPMVKYESEHADLIGPPGYVWQARVYLTKVERFWAAYRQIRPGVRVNKIKVHWSVHSNVALGGGGGVIMPWSQLRTSHGMYGFPWALGHEIGHVFGYGHSPKMNEDCNRAHDLWGQARRYLIEDPDAMPDIVSLKPEPVSKVVTPQTPRVVPSEPEKGKKSKGK